MARVALTLCLLGLALSPALAIQALCNRDGKPSPPINPRIVRNELQGQYAGEWG